MKAHLLGVMGRNWAETINAPLIARIQWPLSIERDPAIEGVPHSLLPKPTHFSIN